MIVPADQFLGEVKRNTDIVSLIKQQTELKLSSGSWVGLCPFHDEKTPSFRVYPESQSFHCYGCQRHGDAFSFVMEQTGCDFAQALSFLAKQANIEQERSVNYSVEDKKRHMLRARDKLAMQAIQNWYIEQLNTTREGAVALKWLGNRGLSADMVERFKLGFAPFNFQPSSSKLSSDGKKLLFDEYYEHEFVRTGVLIKKDQDYYPLLRNRIIFPIHDYQGQCIAFTGRRFDDKSEYKYVNTKTTHIFEKGEVIYGLHLARPHRDYGLVITEGNTDVISMHQFGLNCGIACLGTATTAIHGRILSQRTNKLILAFDADQAGLKAVFRTLNVLAPLLGEKMLAKILLLGKGDDPDSFLHKHGLAPFEKKLQQAMTVSQFIVAEYQKKATIEEKSTYLASLRGFLGNIQDKLYQGLLVNDLAQVFKVDSTALLSTGASSGTQSFNSSSVRVSSTDNAAASNHQAQSSNTPPPAFDEPLPEEFINQAVLNAPATDPEFISPDNNHQDGVITHANKPQNFLGIGETVLRMMERKQFFLNREISDTTALSEKFDLHVHTTLLLELLSNPECLEPMKLQELYANSQEYVAVIDYVLSTQQTQDIYKIHTDEDIMFMIVAQIFSQEKHQITAANYDEFVSALAKLMPNPDAGNQKIRQRYRKKRFLI